jgi:hypothetical protein
MDVNLNQGWNYGDVLTFNDRDKPNLTLHQVYAQIDVDAARLSSDLVALFEAETPRAKNPAPLPGK